MTVVTQQSVAASLSAWHDKIEQSVRNVERQVSAALCYSAIYSTVFYSLFMGDIAIEWDLSNYLYSFDGFNCIIMCFILISTKYFEFYVYPSIPSFPRSLYCALG